jgi:hypothetical protein
MLLVEYMSVKVIQQTAEIRRKLMLQSGTGRQRAFCGKKMKYPEAEGKFFEYVRSGSSGMQYQPKCAS